MQNHDEHFVAIYDDPSVTIKSADDYKIFKDMIVFYDNEVHTISIYTFNGSYVTSASTKYNYPFNLQRGAYILTIDGNKSAKIMIE